MLVLTLKHLRGSGVLLLLLVTGFCHHQGWAMAEEPRFQQDELILYDHGFGDDGLLSLAIDGEGKILASGYVSNGAGEVLAVARFLDDGSIDTSFAKDGIFTLDPGSGSSRGVAIHPLGDGGIAVAATIELDGASLLLVKLTGAGELDLDFAEDGMATVFSGFDQLGGVVLRVDPEKGYYLGATGERASKQQAYLGLVDLTGSLDPEFAASWTGLLARRSLTGLVALELPEEGPAGLVVEEKEGDSSYVLLQLEENGGVKTELAIEKGQLLPQGYDQIEIRASATDKLQNLYLAGVLSGEGRQQAFILKLDREGKRDLLFYQNGWYLLDSSASSFNFMDLFAGEILVAAGSQASGAYQELLTVAVFASGVSESGAEEVDGLAIPLVIRGDLTMGDDIGYGAALLAKGSILAAGVFGEMGARDFGLAEYPLEGLSLAPLSTGVVTASGASLYRITTREATDITRVSALSGGEIVDISNESCEIRCALECEGEDGEGGDGEEGEEDPDLGEGTCYANCLTTCQEQRSVSLRGVVYAVYSAPTYDPDGQEEDDGEEEDGEEGEDGGSVLGSYERVRKGQTEDGSGLGSFTSDIYRVNPGTVYYARAYAVLADDSVIYGNTIKFETSDACFIATAAFGSLNHPRIVLLREFRDLVLDKSEIGRRLISLYYRVSPGLAETLEGNDKARMLVRMLLYPLSFLAGMAVFLTKQGLLPLAGWGSLLMFASLLAAWRLRPHRARQRN